MGGWRGGGSWVLFWAGIGRSRGEGWYIGFVELWTTGTTSSSCRFERL